ncbi:MAG: hypothetical protein LBP21_07255 [Synergistaceae bacterium]|jgi:hypothetical protein|nr:hypothetical protein [Synergistaceae bacterium]
MAYPDRDSEEGSENYWAGGVHGNQEEYEKYLLIKSRLEGKTYRPPRNGKKGGGKNSLLSFYPGLKWVFLPLYLVYATQVVEAYLQWGFGGRFLGSAFYWGVVSSLLWWYFVKRDPGTGSVDLLQQILPDASIPPSLPYWMLLLGCLLASLDLNDFKVWIRGIEHLSLVAGKPLDFDVLLSLRLPRVPFLLKLIASFSILLSGGLLLFDTVTHRILK